MKQKIFPVFFTCIVAAFVAANVKAENSYQENINAEESKVNEKEEKLNEIQSLLGGLNESKSNLDEYLSGLKDSYNAISEYMENLNAEILEKQKQIDDINKELEKAKIERAEQYEAMKLRIKYMYETGDSSFIEVIFSDASLSEILNKVEYTSELLEYDRSKLLEYEQLLTYIEAARLELIGEMENLNALLADQQQRRTEMSSMMSDATANIRNKENEIDAAEARAEQLAIEIQAGKDTIEELKEEESRRVAESIRQSIEQASRDAAGISDATTESFTYNPDDEDLMRMAAIMYCEARGEPYEGILAVGTVVMNRVEDPRFPNTIEEVIMSPKQFSPVASGLYAIAYAKGANETCIKAANEVLYGGVRTGNWLYFRTVNNIIQGTVIGNHVFYYR